MCQTQTLCERHESFSNFTNFSSVEKTQLRFRYWFKTRNISVTKNNSIDMHLPQHRLTRHGRHAKAQLRHFNQFRSSHECETKQVNGARNCLSKKTMTGFAGIHASHDCCSIAQVSKTCNRFGDPTAYFAKPNRTTLSLKNKIKFWPKLRLRRRMRCA